MSSVIDIGPYIDGAGGRLLVMVDLQMRHFLELAKNQKQDLERSLENCLLAIRHARTSGLPIAFTRQSGGPGVVELSAHAEWISGFEPKRSDMVFERQHPSCYVNGLFDSIVSQSGSFTIAGLIAEETGLATAIDAAHRGHHVTFLSDASVCRGRRGADARSVHHVATKAIELFADVRATRHWMIATSQRTFRCHRYG